MSLFDQFASDLAEVIGDFGKPVMWNGQTLSALVAEPELSQSLGIGGYTDEVRFTAKFLRSAFTERFPRIGETATFAGEAYRIVRVSNRPPHPLVSVDLGAKDA